MVGSGLYLFGWHQFHDLAITHHMNGSARAGCKLAGTKSGALQCRIGLFDPFWFLGRVHKKLNSTAGEEHRLISRIIIVPPFISKAFVDLEKVFLPALKRLRIAGSGMPCPPGLPGPPPAGWRFPHWAVQEKRSSPDNLPPSSRESCERSPGRSRSSRSQSSPPRLAHFRLESIFARYCSKPSSTGTINLEWMEATGNTVAKRRMVRLWILRSMA